MNAPALSGRRLRALMIKESLQIVRDPSSLLIAVVLPLILLFVFGYGISLDANKIRVGLVLEDNNADVRDFASAFLDSKYFDVEVARQRQALQPKLVTGELRGLIVVPQGFSARREHGDATAPIQLLTDASQPNTAGFIENYVHAIWLNWQIAHDPQHRAAAPPISLESRFWYNPEAESRNFLVPGSVAIVMTLIGTLLTALVVAREWERGTMEALMATPISIGDLLLGKLVPYYTLGMISMALSTAIAVFLFGVPLRGSFPVLALVTSAFLVAALGLGLLISTLARNQFVAGQVALLAAFLPAFLLSGFVFEIPSMPLPIRAITYVLPARYFVSSLQTLFLAGDIWAVLWRDVLGMLAIAAVLFAVTASKTTKRLD